MSNSAAHLYCRIMHPFAVVGDVNKPLTQM
jgi:hypothetical protein